MKHDEVAIVGASPEAFSPVERGRIRNLIIEGGEVATAALQTNIGNAKALVALKCSGNIRGVAVLKRPQAGYREKIVDQSGFPLPAEVYPYELGYVYIEEGLRKRGYSHQLVAEVLKWSEGAAVFATARADNDRMRAVLLKAGFVPAGSEYAGRSDRMICLLVRKRPT